jgi:hypothetical protein
LGQSKADRRIQKQERGLTMFWAFMIVAVSLMFVLIIIKMSFDHHERIERIKHGFLPTEARADYDEPKRHFN